MKITVGSVVELVYLNEVLNVTIKNLQGIYLIFDYQGREIEYPVELVNRIIE